MIDLTDKRMLYILGFVWADGGLDGNSIITEIKYTDYLELKIITEKTNLDWKYKDRLRYLKKTDKYYKQGCFYLTNKIFCKILYDYDYKVKSYLSPTKILNDIPFELQHHFIRGYIDGDGSFSIYGENIKNSSLQVKFNITSTINYDWTFMIELFNKIGIDNHGINNYDRKSGKSSIIGISNKWDIIKLGEWLYKDSEEIRLERKYNKFLEIKNCNIVRSAPKWTDDDIQFLKDNYINKGIDYCMIKLDRTMSSIYGKVHVIKKTNG